MKGDSHNECNKEDPDKCPACGKAHPAWSKSCDVRQKEIQRIKIAQNNTPSMYESAETEISTHNNGENEMEISDVGWSKVLNRGRKRVTNDSSALPAKARSKALSTPSSSLGEVPDLQARKLPKTSSAGRVRSLSPTKTPTSTINANRTPLGNTNHNMTMKTRLMHSQR